VDTLRHLLPEAYAQADARLRMVFLNACATAQVGITPGTRGLAQTLVRAGVPTAIGMGRPINNVSARAFSAGFYGALAEQGWPFYLAVTEGRRRVMVESGLHGGDWAVPVLFTGTGG
jgi:CHAT domain-containing protein